MLWFGDLHIAGSNPGVDSHDNELIGEIAHKINDFIYFLFQKGNHQKNKVTVFIKKTSP